MQVLEQLYRDGKARAIGVSNYTTHHLQELLAAAEVKPMVNQVCWGVSSSQAASLVGRLSALALSSPTAAWHALLSLLQVEVHPKMPQTALRAFCAEHGIAVVAYASLGCGQLLTEPVVQQVAQRTGKTPAQVRRLLGCGALTARNRLPDL
jgi:diketogulonate reductase-like aldo/keto reductase